MNFFKSIIFAALVAAISADAPNPESENNGNPALRRSVATSSRVIKREGQQGQVEAQGACHQR
ncbi:hypothetical protein DFH28DRAFT_1134703 [Melampsora americana]|nr:hypothetical protein DFH28DRAFT_1134703 [Melampsora americana]